MNVSFNVGESLENGWVITGRNGLSNYVAENPNLGVCIMFESDAGKGINYSRIHGYYDMKADRRYKAQRYLYKYVSLVQSFSNQLFTKYQRING